MTAASTREVDVTGSVPAGGEVLLEVDNLVKHFPVTRGALTRRRVGTVHAVDGVSFAVRRGETFGLVGESGCGKSTIARLVLRLLRPTAGEVRFGGRNVFALEARETRALRADMQLVFQDPFGSLNPRHTVRRIVSEPLIVHNVDRRTIRARVDEMLELCGLSLEHAARYPHEFSGGQRQRVGVARALVLRPKLVVLDEPVSALDVSIRAQVVNLLEDLQHRLGLTYIVIAHDLSVVRHMSDTVGVMYLGQLVEVAPRDRLYEHPTHPYTVGLLSAVPIPDPKSERTRRRIILAGDVPSPAEPPPACRFHTRCWKAQDVCRVVAPPLEERAPGHWSACHFPENTPPARTEQSSPPARRPGRGSSPAGTRVEDVAEPVAQEIEPEDHEEEGQPGP
ncbi:MAG TPA: ABC transporter ATP-binding protein [Acidimicrobiales bacterium]|nr:ABC transporter ATP-binding protein [Acidimicrobiales bacterium]